MLVTPDLFLSVEVLALLAFVGLAAGFVDAIAGGGGLIALPAMLALGIPPVGALATNKAQGVIGTLMAVWTYARGGYVRFGALVIAIATTFAGSYTGAFVVKQLDTSVLEIGVPVLLIGVAAYFTLAPRLSDVDGAARLSFAAFVPVMGFLLGFYDGIFGPGTGSFFTMGFIVLFGLGVTRAAANTKVLNAASNLGALALFMLAGDVLWPVVIVMAIGQIAGGHLGARTGIRFGARLIKPMVVVISVVLALKLLWDQIGAF